MINSEIKLLNIVIFCIPIIKNNFFIISVYQPWDLYKPHKFV